MVKLEPRAMRLLIYLAERAGQVVSVEELLADVWSGVIVTSDSVYQAVAALRRPWLATSRFPQRGGVFWSDAWDSIKQRKPIIVLTLKNTGFLA